MIVVGVPSTVMTHESNWPYNCLSGREGAASVAPTQRGEGSAGPPGFEPGIEAPEASVMSKLYYGPGTDITS